MDIPLGGPNRENTVVDASAVLPYPDQTNINEMFRNLNALLRRARWHPLVVITPASEMMKEPCECCNMSPGSRLRSEIGHQWHIRISKLSVPISFKRSHTYGSNPARKHKLKRKKVVLVSVYLDSYSCRPSPISELTLRSVHRTQTIIGISYNTMVC